MPPGSVLQECPYDQKPRGCAKIGDCCFQHRERRGVARPRPSQRNQERHRAGGGGSTGSDGAPGETGGSSGRSTRTGTNRAPRPQAPSSASEERAAAEAGEPAAGQNQDADENAAKDHLARLLLQGDCDALDEGVLAAIHDLLGV